VQVNEDEAFIEDNILEALGGLSEHMGKISERSYTDEALKALIFRYFLYYKGYFGYYD